MIHNTKWALKVDNAQKGILPGCPQHIPTAPPLHVWLRATNVSSLVSIAKLLFELPWRSLVASLQYLQTWQYHITRQQSVCYLMMRYWWCTTRCKLHHFWVLPSKLDLNLYEIKKPLTHHLCHFVSCSIQLWPIPNFGLICIDDVTTVYLQQTQGIGLLIHLNELLHYSMALTT